MSSSFITVRPATFQDSDGVAYVHWHSWLTTYTGIIDAQYLEKRTLEKCRHLRQEWVKKSSLITFVACLQEEIVGFIDRGPLEIHSNQVLSPLQKEARKEKGEIYALYVLKEHQQQGIGKALLHSARQKLKEETFLPFLVWALEENKNACRFYEHEGAKKVDEVEIKIGQKRHKEVAYQFKS